MFAVWMELIFSYAIGSGLWSYIRIPWPRTIMRMLRSNNVLTFFTQDLWQLAHGVFGYTLLS
jgi:hypothetical protein